MLFNYLLELFDYFEYMVDISINLLLNKGSWMSLVPSSSQLHGNCRVRETSLLSLCQSVENELALNITNSPGSAALLMIPVSRANSCKEPALTSWQRRMAWMVSECEMRNCSTWAAQDGGGREENCIICIIHLQGTVCNEEREKQLLSQLKQLIPSQSKINCILTQQS